MTTRLKPIAKPSDLGSFVTRVGRVVPAATELFATAPT